MTLECLQRLKSKELEYLWQKISRYRLIRDKEEEKHVAIVQSGIFRDPFALEEKQDLGMRILENISLRKKRLRIEMLIRLNNRSANTPRFEYKKSVVTNKFITVSQKKFTSKIAITTIDFSVQFTKGN